MRRVVLASVCFMLVGCGAEPPVGDAAAPVTGTPSAEGTDPTSPDPTEARPRCPNPYGGACLGELAAGTYSTVTFTPRITYTVPAGWSNLEDLPGNFLLLPPGSGLAGVDAGTADYVGIYHGVAIARQTCEGGLDPAVGTDPASMADALRTNPGLDVSEPRAVEVGGLGGVVVDVTLGSGPTLDCPFLEGLALVPLFTGTGPAEVDHAQLADIRTRLYLLEHAGGNVAIEVSDVPGGTTLDELDPVVANLQLAFG